MNAEILARLERSFAPDPAVQIAEAMRSVSTISDADRAVFGEVLISAGTILTKLGK